ncbi:hypothetical protein MN116_007074 [Schistosoma mekongi]|uniref:Saposin B-type domain-containing protein n=1 Tax=Schistosoma mekongi TaxID=38744 RepID=A0AAE1Z8K0_SCHME|nr:hypothetical protein MN116_007074 [Schistosoma mekongi]
MKYIISVIFIVIIGVALSFHIQNTDMPNTKDMGDYQFHDNATCSMCIGYVSHWQKHLNSTKVEDLLRNYAEITCDFSFLFREQCIQTMNKYFNALISFVENHNAETICKFTPFC